MTSEKAADPDAEILTVYEVARFLRVPKSTVYKLARVGQIPASKIGKHWRFTRSEIRTWIHDRSRRSSPLSGSKTGRSEATEGRLG